MTTGTKPPGVAQRVMPFAKWHALHQWSMSADEQQGLVTYLRALAPQSQGRVDFGGHGDRDGGALYAQYCASCHGNEKKGKSAASIHAAIANDTGGMGTLSSLTPAQIAAIAAAP